MKYIVTLRIADRQLFAEARKGGNVTWAGRAEFEDRSDLRETIAHLVTEPGLDRRFRHLRVELEGPMLQLRTLDDLPRVKGRLLERLVEQHAGRYFRKNGEPLVTTARWLPGSNGHRPAKLAAAELGMVETILAGVGEAGFRVDDIVPAGATDSGLSLLPVEVRQQRARAERLSLRKLALLAAGLWLATGASYLAGQARDRKRISAELTSLAPAIQAMAAARREISIAGSMVAAIEREAAGRTRVLALVGSLSTSLPDSAFLTSLTLSGTNSGMLTGYAPSAAALVATLEKSGVVVAPRLEGQTAREVVGGSTWDRFTLKFGPAE